MTAPTYFGTWPSPILSFISKIEIITILTLKDCYGTYHVGIQ